MDTDSSMVIAVGRSGVGGGREGYTFKNILLKIKTDKYY